MSKERRLKHRVRDATDPDLKKDLEPKQAPAQPQKKAPKQAKKPEKAQKPEKQKAPEPEKAPEKAPEQPQAPAQPLAPAVQGHTLKPLDPVMSKKFANRIDRLACVLITALVKKQRPGFVMTIEELEAIEWGESVVDIVNWYLPQLDINSPWPAFAMASIGLGAVVGAKISETPKIQKKKAKPKEPEKPQAPAQTPEKPTGVKVQTVSVPLSELEEKGKIEIPL